MQLLADLAVKSADTDALPALMPWRALGCCDPDRGGLRFKARISRSRGLGFRVYYPPIMENQMEKKMENDMETGGI